MAERVEAPGDEGARRRRADKLRSALAGRPGPTTHRTNEGVVEFGSLTVIDDGDGDGPFVEVLFDRQGRGQPAYRICNPPLLAPDPDGDIHIGDGTFREDPLAALATVVARLTGTTRRRRR